MPHTADLNHRLQGCGPVADVIKSARVESQESRVKSQEPRAKSERVKRSTEDATSGSVRPKREKAGRQRMYVQFGEDLSRSSHGGY